MSEGTVIVTGAGGFLGSHLVRGFLGTGRDVVGIDRASPDALDDRSTNSKYYQIDLPSTQLIEILNQHRPALIIHAAGPSSVIDSVNEPAKDFSESVLPTIGVLEAIRETRCDAKLVFLSSAAVYGEPASLPIDENDPVSPVSPYGWHKAMGELALREYASIYRLKGCSLRIFSAYGPGLRRQVMWDVCRKALNSPAIEMFGTGQETRDFVHVNDVIAAVNTVIDEAPLEGECYNVGTGIETSIADLASWLLAALSTRSSPRFSGQLRGGDPLKWRADISRLRGLGFEPQVQIRQGIIKFAEWALEELPERGAA